MCFVLALPLLPLPRLTIASDCIAFNVVAQRSQHRNLQRAQSLEIEGDLEPLLIMPKIPIDSIIRSVSRWKSGGIVVTSTRKPENLPR